MLVPTAPPWYAAQHGYLPGVTDLISSSLPSYISPYYHMINPNPTAAFPSLHAGFPLLGWRCGGCIHSPPGYSSAGAAWCS